MVKLLVLRKVVPTPTPNLNWLPNPNLQQFLWFVGDVSSCKIYFNKYPFLFPSLIGKERTFSNSHFIRLRVQARPWPCRNAELRIETLSAIDLLCFGGFRRAPSFQKEYQPITCQSEKNSGLISTVNPSLFINRLARPSIFGSSYSKK